MNTTPPNVPNPNNDATPKKRSIVKTILFRVLGSKRIKISAKLLRPNEKQVLQPFKN